MCIRDSHTQAPASRALAQATTTNADRLGPRHGGQGTCKRATSGVTRWEVATTDTSTVRLAELRHGVSQDRRSFERVALRVLARHRVRLWSNVGERPHYGRDQDT